MTFFLEVTLTHPQQPHVLSPKFPEIKSDGPVKIVSIQVNKGPIQVNTFRNAEKCNDTQRMSKKRKKEETLF